MKVGTKIVSRSARSAIKNTPIIGYIVIQTKKLLKYHNKQMTTSFYRKPIALHLAAADRALRQVQNVLNYTKTSGSAYSATEYSAGYHTIELFEQRLVGQRDPAMRLANVPFNFDGKTVLDIGTNQGGMLFAIQDRIKCGIGIDYDHRMINAGNKIKSLGTVNNIHFYVMNIEVEPLDLIRDFVPDEHVDIVFLLSVCMWIKNWKTVISSCSEIADFMLFESNGSDRQQLEQEKVLRQHYGSVHLISDSSEDDPKQKRRKLFLARRDIINGADAAVNEDSSKTPHLV